MYESLCMFNQVTNTQIYVNHLNTVLGFINWSFVEVLKPICWLFQECVSVCVCVLPSVMNTGLIRIAVVSQHSLQHFIQSTVERLVRFQNPGVPLKINKSKIPHSASCSACEMFENVLQRGRTVWNQIKLSQPLCKYWRGIFWIVMLPPRQVLGLQVQVCNRVLIYLDRKYHLCWAEF